MYGLPTFSAWKIRWHGVISETTDNNGLPCSQQFKLDGGTIFDVIKYFYS